jgi:two-component system, cell cycle response regulator
MAERDRPGGKPWDSLPTTGVSSGTVRMDADDILRYRQRQTFRGSLLVIAGSSADVGMHILVEGSVALGREPVGLQLHDVGISRCHAGVEQRGAEHIIRDMGSTNGTLVNGVRLVGEHVLREGDKILLGQTVVKFTLVDETETAYLRQVQHLVGTDDLTGLMSKHRFDAAIKEAIKSAQAMSQPLAAMMMDMDGLKAVNTRHGHNAGADTIRRTGALIGQRLQGRGEACRFGGDEFSAFLPGADLARARQVGEEIRRGVEDQRLEWSGEPLVITISIGVAQLPAELTDFAAFLHLADEALYRAKAKGKNTVSD